MQVIAHSGDSASTTFARFAPRRTNVPMTKFAVWRSATVSAQRAAPTTIAWTVCTVATATVWNVAIRTIVQATTFVQAMAHALPIRSEIRVPMMAIATV